MYIGDKKDKKDKQDVNVEDQIWRVMKDLHVLFRVDESQQIHDKAVNDIKGKPVQKISFFKQKLYEWIHAYRELSISDHLATGINLITQGFTKYKDKLNEYFRKQKAENEDYVKPGYIDQILIDVMDIIRVRLLNLDHTLPKDDASIVNDSEQKEYGEVLKKMSDEMKLHEINSGILNNLMLMYLKSGNAKYSFAYLPKFDDQESVDPYEEVDQVLPGDRPEFDEMYPNIDDQINEYMNEGSLEKAGLLTKIKQYGQLLRHASKQSEKESIYMVIDDTQQKLDSLEQEEYAEAEAEAEAEGEEEFEQYGDDEDNNNAETIEERREKGLKEIFDMYARSQMLIGRKATFEQIQHEISNLNLGEYMKFCKDFKIPCNKVKIAEVFKKIATNSKELFFEDFKSTLWRLFETRDQEEIDKLKKRLREIKKIQKQKDKPQEKPVERPKEVPKEKKKEPNSDLKAVKEPEEKERQRDSRDHDREEKHERNDTIGTPKEKTPPAQPQTISRPKGGDPKNVETLNNIQRDRRDSDLSMDEDNKKDKKHDEKKDDKHHDQKDKDSKHKDDKHELNLKVDAAEDAPHKAESPKKPGEALASHRSTGEDELAAERERILARIEELKAPTQEEYQEEILAYLEIDNPRIFKKKARGFMLPFNTRAPHNDTNSYKIKRKQNIDEIKEKVQKLKKAREKHKIEEEKKKKHDYTKHQNIMRKMHEDLMRDKGIYLAPGASLGMGMSQMSGVINSSGGKRQMGYKVPRKFTLEALGKMDYRDFMVPNAASDDEFKPSDVLDSDEDIDEEIMNMYQYKSRDLMDQQNYYPSPPQKVASSTNIRQNLSVNNSQILPKGAHKRQSQNPITNHLSSVPISKERKKQSGRPLPNKSMLPPQKRENVRTEHRYTTKKGSSSPARKRGNSVVHNIASNHLKSAKKGLANLYQSRVYKSNKHSVSDYSPGRKRKDRLKANNTKSLKRASQYDLNAKRLQEQKLKNILKLQGNKGITLIKKKNRL